MATSILSNERMIYREIAARVHDFYRSSNSYEQLFGEVAVSMRRSLPHVSRDITITQLDTAIRKVLEESGYRWGEGVSE